MHTILVCDDERDIVSAIKIYLEAEGYRVVCAYDGKEALEILRREDIQLVLLDIMMPRLDGISTMAELRVFTNIPVILLTAKSEDADKVLGLNVGADDYITKPFHPAELVARVRSQLRRYTFLGGIKRETESQNILCRGALRLDLSERRLTVDGDEVSLTPTEFSVLKLLMESPGKVFSTSEIYRRVWGGIGSENNVAVHIRHLREKLEVNPAEPRHIKVVWGQGYKIDE